MKRRAFLKTSAAAIALPYLVPHSVFGAAAPSNRINVGFIGCGNQSTLDLPDHVRNFLDCIKSRRDPLGKVEIGHRTASVCHLGNIAMQLARKIKWDPKAEEIAGDPEATALLTMPMRGPWKL
jgi:hypothetical protein